MISYVFKRYELKYLLSEEQYAAVREKICERLSPDEFGETLIQSLYYDTPNFRLARTSIEQPFFKEKLRLRCYGLNDDGRDVFLEMKRKADGVVYKRRIACREEEGEKLIRDRLALSQIGRELGYFADFYGDLAPRVLILYDRTAYFDPQSDLRVTFDRNIRYRLDALDFHSSAAGVPLLPQETVLLELKTGTAFPLWLSELLSRYRIYKTSFSKYGAVYRREFCSDGQKKGCSYV